MFQFWRFASRVRVGRAAYSTARRTQRQPGKALKLGVGAIAGYSVYRTSVGRPLQADAPPYELRKLQLSSQHDQVGTYNASIADVQVSQFWNNPGVYAWGSNSGRVA